MSSFTVQRHINAKFVGLLCTAVFVVCSFQGFSITDSNRNFPINILMPVTIEPQNITVTNFGSITILIIVNKIEETANYQTALDSLECYAKIHNYRFRIEEDGKFSAQCPQKDNFFRRHCITSILLSESDYTLFLDADMGVVNPYRRIEEFIDPRSDILFYDRFYDQEVTAGSYIVKNTSYAQKFLKGYADYFYKLPKSFHGTDNGALHAYLAETIFPNRKLEFSLCMELYNKSADYADLFSYTACIRDVMGKHEQFGKIRIMKKGTGWARDNWLTNSKWSPNRDFIIHGWKKNQLKTYSTKDLPLSLDWTSKSEWYNPIAGRFQLEQCTSSNLTWLYDPNLIATKPEIDTKLVKMEREVEMERYKFLGRIPTRLMKIASSVNINNNNIVPNGNKTFGSITILVVLVSLYHAQHYKHALDSVDCYARIQNYNYRLVADTDYRTECPHRDKFFRRHCVVALLLSQSDYTLFLDADMGVVNPKRRIEEFIDPRFGITFYDRFYNQEIMAGSYIVRNSNWARDFLNGFANYEQRLPNSFHGTDNGALHAYTVETLFPNSRKEYEICLKVYNSSANFDDLFSYIACIRHFLGATEDFGRIRIMKKGTAWARDCWLTNSKWNPKIDFMMHGWKLNQLKTYEKKELPITWEDFYYDWTLIEHSRSEWYNPLAEPIQLEKCMPGNTTWSYDENLIADKRSIEEKLEKFRYEVEVKRYYYLGRIPEILQP